MGRDENVSKMDVDCRPGRRPVGKAQSGRRRPVENVSGRRRPVEKPVVDGRRCRRQADVFITPYFCVKYLTSVLKHCLHKPI